MGLVTKLLGFVVTLTWLAAYWTGTAWAPMEAGYVVYKVVNVTEWRVYPLSRWGAYKTLIPAGSMVLWAVNADNNDTCVAADPPTAQGPANMGVEENAQTPKTYYIRFIGDCKP